MPIVRRQAAVRTVAYSNTAKATFQNTVTPGNFVVVVATAKGGDAEFAGPASFSLAGQVKGGGGVTGIRTAVWYLPNVAVGNTVTVSTKTATPALTVRALEYSGVAQSNVLDRPKFFGSEDNDREDDVDSGATGVTGQADELCIAVVANRHASTTQGGFSGGFSKLFDDTSPSSYFFGAFGVNDSDRHRQTAHERITTVAGTQRIRCELSSGRDHTACVVTFRGGSTGAAMLAASGAVFTLAGAGRLDAFGPLAAAGAAFSIAGEANMDVFDYQYRLNGLLVGDGTVYDVVSHDGLEGWEVRTSDTEQPRGDGDLRGIDLQTARQVVLEIEVGPDGPVITGGSQAQVETRLETLLAALVPRRDTDWELIWRHPGRPVRRISCRPISMPRKADWAGTLLAKVPVALRAADPRHYGRARRRLVVPASPAVGAPTQVIAANEGDVDAYPTVSFVGAVTEVTGVALANVSANVELDVRTVLGAGQTLVADMQGRVSGAPRSVITLDGVSRYGAWQLPREPLPIVPGNNLLELHTTPPGVTGVVCVVEWSDTWAG